MTVQQVRYKLSMTLLRGPVTAFRHRDVRASDTFIASYPRAGSTWLRCMLVEALTGKPSRFSAVDRAIPQIGFHTDPLLTPDGGRIIKTHEAFRPEYRRAIYLARDPRDVLLSEHAFQKALGLTTAAIDDYIDDFVLRRVSANGSWRDHTRGWLDAAEKNPDIRIFRFEDLRRDTENTLQEIVSALGLSPDRQSILDAIQNNSVEGMRAKERAEPQKASKKGKFVREGASGGWKKNLTPEQARRIDGAMPAEMKRLNYLPTDDALAAASSTMHPAATQYARS